MTGVRAIQLGQRYYVVTFMNKQTAHQYPEMCFLNWFLAKSPMYMQQRSALCSDLQECFVDGSKLFKLFDSRYLDILDSLDGF